MKYYKLLKDLPLAKEGTIVTLDIQSVDWIIQSEDGNEVFAHIDVNNTSEWLEEIPQKPKSVFDLKFGDRYFTKDSSWTTIERNWQNNYTENQLQKEGKIFLTKEECDKDYEKELAIQRIKKYCWENNIDTSWKWRKERYYIPVKIDNDIKIDYWQEYKTASYIWYFYDWNTLHFLIQECKNDLKIIFDIE